MTISLRQGIIWSGLGHAVHNLAEFGLVGGLGQTVVPGVITLAFYVSARRPTRPYLWLLGLWGALVVVLGGLSVLPLSILPFEPAQTVGHYAAHVAYILFQLPVLMAVRRSYADLPQPHGVKTAPGDPNSFGSGGEGGI